MLRAEEHGQHGAAPSEQPPREPGEAATPNSASANQKLNLAEVVRVPRPTPQAAVHHLAGLLAPDEPVHLCVGDELERDGAHPDDERDDRRATPSRARAW